MRDDLVEVYEAGSFQEATMIVERLRSSGIDAFVENADSPLDGLTYGAQTFPVRVLPTEGDLANLIVEGFLAEQQKLDID